MYRYASFSTLTWFCIVVVTAAHASASSSYDIDQALQRSQAAIGRNLADVTLTDRQGQPVALSVLRGKPLIISLIYTSCSMSSLSPPSHRIWWKQ
ncbi:MAG: hypothetical protein HQL58_11695, partial [Magnetococcales bacterium]|nr:hypothetical protein [Magnetococcales bacterium]